MAYRQLCATALVFLGLVSVGCGKGSSLAAMDGDSTNDAPPSSADDSPPGSADDRPPTSDDSPPSSEETPPGSSDSPGDNGELQALCEDVCEFFEELSDCIEDGQGSDSMGLDEICSGGCQVPEPAEPIPCRQEIAAMFDCILGLGSLCPEDGGQEQAAMCEDAFTRFSACAEREGLDDDPNPPNPAQMCTPTEGCECPTACSSCLCENPGAAQECIEECSADTM